MTVNAKVDEFMDPQGSKNACWIVRRSTHGRGSMKADYVPILIEVIIIATWRNTYKRVILA